MGNIKLLYISSITSSVAGVLKDNRHLNSCSVLYPPFDNCANQTSGLCRVKGCAKEVLCKNITTFCRNLDASYVFHPLHTTTSTAIGSWEWKLGPENGIPEISYKCFTFFEDASRDFIVLMRKLVIKVICASVEHLPQEVISKMNHDKVLIAALLALSVAVNQLLIVCPGVCYSIVLKMSLFRLSIVVPGLCFRARAVNLFNRVGRGLLLF